MPTIIVSTTDTKETLHKVYQSDPQAGYCNNQKTVHGSVVTASIVDNKTVKIISSYYNENTLRQMFDN